MFIYFAITGDMISRQGMPETTESGVHKWKLSGKENCLPYSVGLSSDEVLNRLSQYEEAEKCDFVICKGRLTEIDVVVAFRCLLIGDCYYNFDVDVIEMVKMK